jgi:transposase
VGRHVLPVYQRRERRMYRLLVGIDVSKDFFSAAGLDGEGEELFSGSYEMNSHGFSEFLKIISSHGEGLDQVLVAMESTGCYHINLYSFLASQGSGRWWSTLY